MRDRNNMVTVLMSTYNGEKYLKEQIDSILSQVDVDVRLVIRDDGSTDNTVGVIKEYSQRNSNVEFTVGKNIGYANSFLTLIQMAGDSDYYAFSDQDDIWKKNKLSTAVDKINGIPYVVYASNLEMVSENGEFIAMKRFDNFKGSVGGVLSRNRLAGCTMVFGKDVKETITPVLDNLIHFNTFNYGHDGWLLLCAILYGGQIVVDENSYIRYRRHESAVTSSHGGLKKRLKNELRIFWNKDNKRVRIAGFLLESFSADSEVMKQKAEVLRRITKYRKSLGMRCKLLFGHDLDTNIPAVDMKNKIAVLMGRY
ncbi:MAG: glycosyltransferase [Lachnospiraceae bacterium]|nr:glycosyltransferase [Lachnospiraceae bacterium]